MIISLIKKIRGTNKWEASRCYYTKADIRLEKGTTSTV
jgi:hypothetical protein